MKVYVLQEVETKDDNEPAIETTGVFSTYRMAAEKLMRKNYKVAPIQIFRQPSKHEVDYFKRDGLYEYTAEISEHEIDEY